MALAPAPSVAAAAPESRHRSRGVPTPHFRAPAPTSHSLPSLSPRAIFTHSLWVLRYYSAELGAQDLGCDGLCRGREERRLSGRFNSEVAEWFPWAFARIRWCLFSVVCGTAEAFFFSAASPLPWPPSWHCHCHPLTVGLLGGTEGRDRDSRCLHSRRACSCRLSSRESHDRDS